MKPWMWLLIAGVGYYLWTKRSNLVPLPESTPSNPTQEELLSVQGYDDPGARLAEQVWGYSIVPNSNQARYIGRH